MGWSLVWKMNSCNTWIDPCNTWVQTMYYMGYPVTFTTVWRCSSNFKSALRSRCCGGSSRNLGTCSRRRAITSRSVGGSAAPVAAGAAAPPTGALMAPPRAPGLHESRRRTERGSLAAALYWKTSPWYNLNCTKGGGDFPPPLNPESAFQSVRGRRRTHL